MSARTCPIAMVEDDASFSRAIARLLRASGLEAQVFTSAEEFLASPEPETWPCLILDIQLPGISGIELLEHLQTLAPSQPAIFVTAQDEDEVREQVKQVPGCVLLRKPVRGAELLAAVRARLDSSRAEPAT